MRRILYLIAIITLIWLLVPLAAHGQAIELKALSRRLLLESRARREEAHRLALDRGWPIQGTNPAGGGFGLIALAPNGMPLYYSTRNADAARMTRTDRVQALIGGAPGITVGIWDMGAVRATHQELSPRVTWEDDEPEIMNDHATHVGGTLIAQGIDPAAKGMAYQADLISYSWFDDFSEMAFEASDGLLLSNHSYGPNFGWDLEYDGWYWRGDTVISETEDYHFGFYDDEARQWDEVAHAAPDYLIVVAAGNERREGPYDSNVWHYFWNSGTGQWEWSTKYREKDGGSDGYDCLPAGSSVAKNLLSIGMVYDFDEYRAPTDVVSHIFSSWGPTDDGRIKPDLVGSGEDLYSSSDTNDVAYTVKLGTSMASPNVCGSLALLQKYYMDQHASTPMKAATLKSLAIHTARETGEYPGPDYKCGWGLLDSYAAYELIVEDLDTDKGLIDELTLSNGSTLEFDYFCHGADSMFKVTICWSDPEATPLSPALNPPDPMLINDLDLRVEKVGGAVNEPWTLNRSFPDNPAAPGDNDRDNVEQVAIYTPEVGHYIIRITHKGTLDGGSQDVSMIVSGGERINNVWHVYEDGSGDAPDISTAASLAVDRDLILVHPGTYTEHDIAVDKELLICSYSGPDNTIVDAQSLGRCFYLLAAAGPGKLVGFTLRNGAVSGSGISSYGGAILCTNPDAFIVNCRITLCEAVFGGGIACYYASSSIVKCRVDGNFANNGGGVYLYESDPSLAYCVVAGDSSIYGGGGIYCSKSSPSLLRCTISGNATTMYGAGISIAGNGSAPLIENTIISYNTGGTGVYVDAIATGADIGCSDVYGNPAGNYGGYISDQTGINGNISADPVFCNPAALDFGIGDGSPCRAGANPCGVWIGACDIGCHTKTLWYVIEDGSGDATTIQYGIDVAHNGDTVLVAAGTYDGTGNKDLTMEGKSIHLLSEAGPEATIIDCNAVYFDPVAGINVTQGEDSTTIIEGFTITGADKGGIICTGGSSPTIRDCIVTLNENDVFEDYRGGGIYLEDSDAIIIDCEILDNLTHLSGAGIYCTAGSSPMLEGCTVSDNDAGASGGGIHIDGGSTMILIDCTVNGNDTYPYDGGGIYAYGATLTLENCTIDGNSAHRDGGGIYSGVTAGVTLTGSSISSNTSGDRGAGIYYYALLNMENCTIVGNSSGGYGAGLYAVNAGSGATTETIIAFNVSGHGIYTASSSMNISCSDVYGNEAGNYGGNLPDQTGSNDNISDNPLFCDFGTGDYHIYNISPCTPASSPCGELIGRFGIDCLMAPDLVITDVQFSATELELGESLTATVKIKNIGNLAAENFYLDYHEDLLSPPAIGQTGDQRLLVANLEGGDSLVWTTDPTASACFEQWESYFHVDSADSALEHDEGNNISGPYKIDWAIPLLAGWPVHADGEFNSSPAIALLDDDPVTQEVIVGCDDGYVYAWTADGSAVPGWPVYVDRPVQSSPAVGNVAGDYHPEVVFGCEDGYLYVYDHTGNMLWRYGTGQPITTTPALADLDNDGLLEVVLGAKNASGDGCIYVMDNDGTDFTGSWPLVVGGTYASSAAVGDVDIDGRIEIAVVATGFTKPDIHSKVFLLNKSGIDYGAGWPAVIDTVIGAPPVLGNIAFDDGLEIITGGINGRVYGINLSGVVSPGPYVGGIIEQSPALTNADKDTYQEIIVSSRYWHEPVPPFGYWVARVSVVDNDGTLMAGWPRSGGTWSSPSSALSPIALEKKVITGSRNGRVYGWTASTGLAPDGFPLPDRGTMGGSPAIGDLDGDGYMDLVAPAGNDSAYCYDLGCSSDYGEDVALFWPMFRHDPRRTGCYVFQGVTDADIPEESTPSITALRSIYPNPFNPATRITFDLRKRSQVQIVIYDVAGRRVCTLVDGILEAGRHDVAWQGTTDEGYSAASGVYFCRFVAAARTETKKMILLR